MSDENALTFEIDGNTAIITLNRAKKLNALTTPLYTMLGDLLREADAHPDTLVTLLIGTGRFFSAGADLMAGASAAAEFDDEDPRNPWFPAVLTNTVDVPNAFFTHSKILICALNGPAVGLSAALVSHADFVYAVPSSYIVTPFGSLGLVPEGGSSVSFVRRLGLNLANEALLKGRKISALELAAVGFVSRIFDVKEESEFRARVLEEIKEAFGPHLVPSSVTETKRMLRKALVREQEGQAIDELLTNVRRFGEGIPQEEMMKVMTGKKKHKL